MCDSGRLQRERSSLFKLITTESGMRNFQRSCKKHFVLLSIMIISGRGSPSPAFGDSWPLSLPKDSAPCLSRAVFFFPTRRQYFSFYSVNPGYSLKVNPPSHRVSTPCPPGMLCCSGGQSPVLGSGKGGSSRAASSPWSNFLQAQAEGDSFP